MPWEEDRRRDRNVPERLGAPAPMEDRVPAFGRVTFGRSFQHTTRTPAMFRFKHSHPFLDRSTALHDERLDTVVDILRHQGAHVVVDLGCGSGALIERLLRLPGLRWVLGLDRCGEALAAAHRRLAPSGRRLDARVALRQGCVTIVDRAYGTFDAAVAVETIEHLPPDRLSALENGLFQRLRPRHVLITTPNRDYNGLLGLADGERRHPDHRFEWGRRRFERWASGVAERNDCEVAFQPIGPVHAWHGSPTQMVTFRCRTI